MNSLYVVTGASSGIGYALCCHLADRHKKVIAVARRNDYLASLKNEHPQHIITIKADLSTQSGREKVIHHLSTLGRIQGLVNNAATNEPISLLQNLSLDEWHQQAAINLDAPLFLTQGLLPFIKTTGRIVNITTGTTNFIASGIASYAMTKAAINVFTKYLNEELRSKEIFVTAAHPGVVNTEMALNIKNHGNSEFEIFKAQEHFQQNGKYLDVNVSAKFLCWLLLDADETLYRGEIIGIYNKKYQSLWHDEFIPSPYPDAISPP